MTIASVFPPDGLLAKEEMVIMRAGIRVLVKSSEAQVCGRD
jgi:hypothetical protein